MSRVSRLQKPGAIFHITSRTQGREPWFVDELRSRIASIIVDGICSSGAFLIGYAVMPNHFHIIAAQGGRSWGWTMKPIGQRIALLVQRKHNLEGHVFERRFFSKECNDADHVRTAIHYTHRNPLKARICGSAGDYAWSSHNELCDLANSTGNIIVRDVLKLFAAEAYEGEPSDDVLLRDYLNHMKWWFSKKAAEENGEPFLTPEPPVRGGDLYFMERFESPCAPLLKKPNEDLRDRAHRILRIIEPNCEMELLRHAHVGRRAGHIRNQVMAGLLSCYYPGCDVARFFRVSPSVVSRINSAARWNRGQ